jgi:hypothetical protein
VGVLTAGQTRNALGLAAYKARQGDGDGSAAITFSGEPTWVGVEAESPAPQEHSRSSGSPLRRANASPMTTAPFKTERGIPDMPRAKLPSRQDRSAEYAKRNRARRHGVGR